MIQVRRTREVELEAEEVTGGVFRGQKDEDLQMEGLGEEGRANVIKMLDIGMLKEEDGIKGPRFGVVPVNGGTGEREERGRWREGERERESE